MANIAQLLTEHMDIWTGAETEKKSGRGRASGNGTSVYGVKKLRELILGLAISGKLLPQNPTDTSAHEAAQKLGLKRKDLNEDLLVKFDLPSTWQWFCVSDLCDLKTGATPSTSISAYYGGHIKWLVSGDIHGNEIYDCEGRITELGLNNSNCKILPKNSILIALNGQGKTRATVAMLRCEAACNQSLVAMISKYDQLILPEFIWLNLKYRYTEIRDITGQNQRRGLNMGLIGDLSVSVPPLLEQHRIINKVDELMALCDQLEQQHSNAQETHENLVSQLLATLTQSQNVAEFNANWQRIYGNFDLLFTTEASIDTLKQTLLQLAVMGKLVPQDPNDEPASELLKRIQTEKAQLIAAGKLKKEKPLAPIAEDEKPFELPYGWEWARFSAFVLSIISGGTPSKNKPEYWSGNIPWASVKDLNVERYLTKTEDYITEEGLLAGSKLANKDDLIICTRMGLGKIAIAAMEVAINQDLKSLKLTPYLNVDYFINFYGTLKIAGSGMTVAGIKQEELLGYCVPLPPHAEQHRIIAKVDELMVLCDQLKTRLQQANQQQKAIADLFVQSVVGTTIKSQPHHNVKMEKNTMKIVSPLIIGSVTEHGNNAKLAQIIQSAGGQLEAKSVWQESKLDLKDFYKQLKIEIDAGFILKPSTAFNEET